MPPLHRDLSNAMLTQLQIDDVVPNYDLEKGGWRDWSVVHKYTARTRRKNCLPPCSKRYAAVPEASLNYGMKA